MKRLTFEFAVMVLMFFGTWFLVSQINFTESEQYKKIETVNETKLGELIFDFVEKTNRIIESDSATHYLNKIKDRICENNDIDSDKLEILLVYNSEVNAFAIPGNKIIVHSGLIDYCNNSEELASILSHEIAHIEKNHIMKKMGKEIGLSVISAVLGGNGSGDMIREIVSVASSRAFDREMEEEADETAVEYLANASIDPEHFSNFMFRLSHEELDIPTYLEWSSTHPDTKDRSVVILEFKKNFQFTEKTLLSETEWENLKNSIQANIEL